MRRFIFVYLSNLLFVVCVFLYVSNLRICVFVKPAIGCVGAVCLKWCLVSHWLQLLFSEEQSLLSVYLFHPILFAISFTFLIHHFNHKSLMLQQPLLLFFSDLFYFSAKNWSNHFQLFSNHFYFLVIIFTFFRQSNSLF